MTTGYAVGAKPHLAPDVAAIIAGDSSGTSRDITISLHGGGLSIIDDARPCYDPLSYALMRPMGGRGWALKMPHAQGVRNVTSSQFSAYRLMMREALPNTIHLCGRLLRQYICDQWSKIGQRRLQKIRKEQDTLREPSYRQVEIRPQVSEKGAELGRRITPPPTCAG